MEYNFRMLGTPEYLLARAGLFESDGAPSRELIRLFAGKPLPSSQEVVEALVRVAYLCNGQAGGAIDVIDHQAVAGLKRLGMTDGYVHTVFKAITGVIGEVAAECRARPMPVNL
jgi:hypothetical protein